MLEEWQQRRAVILEEFASVPSSINALVFMESCTDDRFPIPGEELEYVVDRIVERPALLANERFRAAQYFEDHVRREKPVCVEVLAGLLRDDVKHTGRGWFFVGERWCRFERWV